MQTKPTPAQEVEFEVVEHERRADPSIPANKKGAGGRPLKLTERRFNRIVGHIRAGMTATSACRAEGITYTSWRGHIRDNEEWAKRLAEAEVERDDLLRDKCLEVLQTAFPKNWAAAAWMLERRWPELYALKTVNRNLNSTEAPVFERVSESEMLENAKHAAAAALNPPPGLAPTSSDGATPEPPRMELN